jgi:hypothetical protein
VSGTTLVLLVSYLRGGRTVRAEPEAESVDEAELQPSPLALAPVTAPRAP